MKITKCESMLLHVPMQREIADSMQAFTHIEFAAVRIETDTGIAGTGYTLTVGAGGASIQSALDTLFCPHIVGRNPYDVREIWYDLYHGKSHWVGRSGITTMAQACIDMALWDIIAKTAQQPLWRMLGGGRAEDVPIYNTDAGWLSLDRTALQDEMKGLLDEGYTAVKMKVGGPDPAEDYRRVKAVREVVGDDVTLMVDVNQKWDLVTAQIWGHKLGDFDLTWLEEPLHPDDVTAHRKLRTKLQTPIALGEHVYTTPAFRDFIQDEAVDIVQVDVTRVGGVTPFLEVAALAHAYGLKVCPHAGDMSQVHQHMVRAIPNSWLLEVIPAWADDVFRDRIQLEDGKNLTPMEPGASTEFREEAVAEYRVA